MLADLMTKTKYLKKQVSDLAQKFFKNDPPESLRDHDFFNKVRAETGPFYKQLDLWEEETLAFIKKYKARIHPHQVVATKENYHLIMMHSYYIDARERRYMELKYSILYVFDILIEDIRNVMEEDELP